jgi:hypothetical protein
MTVAALPTPSPARTQTQTAFDAAVAALIAALPTMISQFNTDIGTSNSNTASAAASAIATAADAISTAANAAIASASAASSVMSPTTNATSVTSNSIPTSGLPTAKSFTTQTGKNFAANMTLEITSTASPTNYMIGKITSYNSGTGALVMSITYSAGSGTFADWTINLSGQVLTTTNNSVQAQSTNRVLALSDKGAIFGSSSTITFTIGAASVLGNSWYYYSENIGTGVITHTTNAADSGGSVSFTQDIGDYSCFVCDGSSIRQHVLTPARTLGGSTHSGSYTWAASNGYAQKATPTTWGQGCTLPSALTLGKGAILSLYNASDYDYAFYDSTGVIRAFVGPWKTCAVALADNTTAAGAWTFSDSRLLAVTASAYNTASSGNSSGSLIFISLDSNRTLLLHGYTTCFARVYRKSTNAWSSDTVVASSLGASAFTGIKSATDQVLVCTNDVSTGMSTVVLSINSTTDAITVGTPVSTTLAGTWSAYGQMIATAAGTSWIIPYGRATNVTGFRAITISGTTPTVGAETALSPANTAVGHFYAVTGGVILAMSTDTTTFYSKPYTITGSSIAAGTGATTTVTATAYRSMVVGTRWHAHVQNANLTGIVISVSGTTSTHSAAVLSTNINQVVTGDIDALVVGSSKSCTFGHNASTSVYANILTDTAGTASAGTELAIATGGTAAQPAAISVSGNTCKFSASDGNTSHNLYTFDASGASPTLSSFSESGGGSSGVRGAVASDSYGNRGARLLSSTVGAVVVSTVGNGSASTGGYLYGTNLRHVDPIIVGFGNVGTSGLTSAESWFMDGTNNVLQKVEVAQP